MQKFVRVPAQALQGSQAVDPPPHEDLKSLMAAMVEATQRNEVGALNYEWAISDDRQVCHLYERYQDSAAAMAHLKSFGANFASRFMEVVKPTRLVVYGTPSAQVKDALAVQKVLKRRCRFLLTCEKQVERVPSWTNRLGSRRPVQTRRLGQTY